VCLENVIYITKQEKVSREAKTKFRQCDWSAKKFAAKKLDQFLLFYLSLRASKFAQWKTSFYFLLNIQLLLNILLTYDVIDVNECFHDFMFVNIALPPLRSGKFSSTALPLVQSLAKSLLHYSSTIRTIRRLFVDYSRTIRTIRRLSFADYSYYSSTIRAIRTIRFTILVLSITN
jgi:hypothetical protein